MAGRDHQTEPERRQGGFLSSRAGIVLIAFLVIIGFLLATEHRAHTLGVLFWLLILACPLLHIFMHGGHGEHAGRKNLSTDGHSRRSPTKGTARER